MTSEDIPINQQSSSLRTLIVKIKRGTLSGEILEDFQYRTFGEHTLSQAYFSAFIHYVEENYWRILNLVHTFEGGEVDLRFLRMRRTYRTLCIIAEIVLGWGHEIGTLSLECRDKMLDTWRRIIFDVVKENDDAAVVSEPYQVFLWGLRSLIIAHPHVLANSKTSYFMNTGNCIGYLEKGMYFLDQGETFLKVNELLAKHEKNLVATQSSILRRLYENGILLAYDKQRASRATPHYQKVVSLRLNGEGKTFRRNLLCLLANRVDATKI